MHRTVGLDFGTTTTLLAAEGSLVPLGTRLDPWLPSLVGLVDDGSVVVGEAAEEAVSAEIVRSVKRAITKRWNEVRDSAVARLGRVTADDLILEVLREVDARALRHGVDLAEPGPMNVGCPAVWDSGQRDRLRRLLARVFPARTITLVDEPVAAGIAWLVGQPSLAHPTRVLVFDMGGGTLDIAVIDVGGPGRVSLLAAVGRTEAGDALDETIADDLAGRLGIVIDPGDPRLEDPREEDLARQRRELLLDAARRLKTGLSIEDEYVVVLDRQLFGTANEVWFTRAELATAFGPQLDRAVDLVRVALRAAALTEETPRAVDVVLLSGGMSRVAQVPQRLRELFGPAATVTRAADPPETAVVLGLASASHFRRDTRYALGYDIVLEWDGGSCTLYEAHMPILETWWLERDQQREHSATGVPAPRATASPSEVMLSAGERELRFLCTGRGLRLPGHGTGKLRVEGDGRRDPNLNGESLDGYPVTLNGEQFELSIYPSGRLRMVDGAGVHEGRTRD